MEWGNTPSNKLEPENQEQLYPPSKLWTILATSFGLLLILGCTGLYYQLRQTQAELAELKNENKHLKLIAEDRNREIFDLRKKGNSGATKNQTIPKRLTIQNHQSKKESKERKSSYKPAPEGKEWATRVGTYRALDSYTQDKKSLQECMGEKKSIDPSVIRCMNERDTKTQ
ncbi:hypothetical protein [Gilvimarinus sp. DA14]|uniref:hypothetical protein n=1 Tax=Gilvimarinus sp. DA14 TaxID=2956798 RepID=UPI0020B76D3B|nr:hypothetical protein [Gilvimarinus sp. DA14]UTF61288.1 hypothetical protein NHM04_05670 [Gilvimarinus sp. DA14]